MITKKFNENINEKIEDKRIAEIKKEL